MTPRITSVLLCVCALSATLPAAAIVPRPMARLRPATSSAAALIERAMRDSPTVRRLAAEIAASDLIVYVELDFPERPARATTELVTVTAHDRFLRITLDRLVPAIDQIALLAHEMQHAAEIARETSVRDSASLRALYARIGIDPAERRHFETMEARLTERAARRESFRRPR